MGRFYYQVLLDHLEPLIWCRWFTTTSMILFFLSRVIVNQGWYLVCYAHAIYVMNLLQRFLQPNPDSSSTIQDDIETSNIEEGNKENPVVPPVQITDKSRSPTGMFSPSLSEVNFWFLTTIGTATALWLSYYEVFDIAVSWPILMVYFWVASALTLGPLYWKRFKTSGEAAQETGENKQPPGAYDEEQVDCAVLPSSTIGPEPSDNGGVQLKYPVSY